MWTVPSRLPFRCLYFAYLSVCRFEFECMQVRCFVDIVVGTANVHTLNGLDADYARSRTESLSSGSSSLPGDSGLTWLEKFVRCSS